jgi:AraC-like DNA-binding protein
VNTRSTDATKRVGRAGSLFCALSERQPFDYPAHTHETVEILAIPQGSSTICSGTGSLLLEAGDVVVIMPFEAHWGRTCDPHGARFFAVHVSREHLKRAGLHSLRGAPGPLANRHYRSVLTPELCEQISQANSMEKFVACAERVFDALARQEQVATTSEPDWLDELAERLGTLPPDDFSSARSAAAYGLNPRYFATRFKSRFGLSPRDLSVTRRVELARNALLTDAPIAQIAGACGFADQAHMSRCFRRIYGLPPQAFRRNNPLVGAS